VLIGFLLKSLANTRKEICCALRYLRWAFVRKYSGINSSIAPLFFSEVTKIEFHRVSQGGVVRG